MEFDGFLSLEKRSSKHSLSQRIPPLCKDVEHKKEALHHDDSPHFLLSNKNPQPMRGFIRVLILLRSSVSELGEPNPLVPCFSC